MQLKTTPDPYAPGKNSLVDTGKHGGWPVAPSVRSGEVPPSAEGVQVGEILAPSEEKGLLGRLIGRVASRFGYGANGGEANTELALWGARNRAEDLDIRRQEAEAARLRFQAEADRAAADRARAEMALMELQQEERREELAEQAETKRNNNENWQRLAGGLEPVKDAILLVVKDDEYDAIHIPGATALKCDDPKLLSTGVIEGWLATQSCLDAFLASDAAKKPSGKEKGKIKELKIETLIPPGLSILEGFPTWDDVQKISATNFPHGFSGISVSSAQIGNAICRAVRAESVAQENRDKPK